MKIVSLLTIVALFSCDKNNDKNKGRSSSQESRIAYGTVKLKSSTLTGAASLANTPPAPGECVSERGNGLSRDIYFGEGFCLTPLNVEGYTSSMDISTTSVGSISSSDPDVLINSKSARIFGLEEKSENGELNVGKEFSLLDLSSSGFVGSNTLYVQYPYKASYEYLTMELLYQRVKFYINGKYVTMLIAAYSQPYATSDEISKCGLSESVLSQSRFKNADRLTGLSFKRGDYLFCVKDSDSDVCATSDFKWLDLSTNTLVSVRPTTPRQYKWPNETVSCKTGTYQNNPESFSVSTSGGLRESAKIPSKDAFKLFADFSHGELSQQWPKAERPYGEQLSEDIKTEVESLPPFLIYYYEKDGAKTEGTTLKVDFDVDATGFLFFEGIDDNDAATTTLETLLSKVYTVGGWVFSKKAASNVEGHGPEQYYGLSVTPTVTVSGGKGAPQVKALD